MYEGTEDVLVYFYDDGVESDLMMKQFAELTEKVHPKNCKFARMHGFHNEIDQVEIEDFPRFYFFKY